MTGTAHIIRGNALSLPLPDASVDLICTSPPYFGLRSYQDAGEHYAGQIGAEPTPAEFVDALIAATREMVRVLKPSGSIWVNLGDKYAGGGSGPQGATGQRIGRSSADEPYKAARRARGHGVPDKSLIGIPWRYAIRCIDDLGLILRAEVIWAKPNGLPESVTDRVRRSHEQWFHFTKSPRYFSAVDEIREGFTDSRPLSPAPTQAGVPNRGTNGGMTGKNLGTLGHPLGKLPGSVWSIPTQPLQVPASLGIDHFAAYPMELPRRIIRGWSPAGVCVVCGEGRRPVVSKVRTNGARGLISGAMFQPGQRTETADGKRHEFHTDATITGYACACSTAAGAPSGCSICGRDERGHGDAYTRPYGGHYWAKPDDALIKARMRHELPPTTPAVVLDPFGGTGTTALVAKSLGRTGISVDMSADYCRLAEWRTTDRGQLAAALQVEKPAVVHPDQLDLFSEAM